jgi:hypothetical protein
MDSSKVLLFRSDIKFRLQNALTSKGATYVV